jgi:HTH-type transcriptional regulator / antitoxin HipB
MSVNQFADMVLFHRKKSGLSREEFALLAGVGKTAIFDIEHGKASVQMDTVLKVLNVLNIKMQFSSPIMHLFEATKMNSNL